MMRRFTSAPKPRGAGGPHHLRRRGRVDPQPVAHAVEAGQVRRRLGRGDQVVGRQPVDGGRHRDLVELGAGRLEGVGRLPHPGGHVGRRRHVALEHLPHEPDPQALDTPPDAGPASARAARGSRWSRPGRARRSRRRAGRRRPRWRRTARSGRARRRRPPARSATPARRSASADHAAQRGGLADRAAGVRAQGQGGEAGRHRRRRCRPTSRPAPGWGRGGCGWARRPSSRWSCPWRTRRGWSCRRRPPPPPRGG